MTQEHNTNSGDSPTRDMPAPDHTVIIDVPRELGTYRLTKLLGRGGMGEVWQAFDRSLERDVAIKLMRKELTSNEEATKRFAREARAVARLNHPNIVQVYAYGDEKGLNYFVMELVEGETVSQCLKRKKQIPLEDALHIMLQAVEGLSYANARGIIHRDIKPSNLMITENDHRVKIADFGLAKMVEHDTQMTAAGTAMGSPNYMSPEQARGEEADHRSDIYALGVSLYQMLCGDLPFTASSPVSVLLKQVQEPLPEHQLIRCMLNGNVMAVLKTMTAKNPAERYQSYEQLSNALAALQPNIKFKGAHLPTSSMPAATPAQGLESDRISKPGNETPSVHFGPPPPPVPTDGGSEVVSSRDYVTPSPTSVASPKKAGLLFAALITVGLISGIAIYLMFYKHAPDEERPAVAAILNESKGYESTAPTPSPAAVTAIPGSPSPTPLPTATPAPSSMQPVDVTAVVMPSLTPIPGKPTQITPTPTLAELAPSSGRLIIGGPNDPAGQPVNIYDANGNVIAQQAAGAFASLIRPLTLRGERWLAIRHGNGEAFIPEASARQDNTPLLPPKPDITAQPADSQTYILGMEGASPSQAVPLYIDEKARTEYKKLPAGTELKFVSESLMTYKVMVPGESRPLFVLKKLVHRKP